MLYEGLPNAEKNFTVQQFLWKLCFFLLKVTLANADTSLRLSGHMHPPQYNCSLQWFMHQNIGPEVGTRGHIKFFTLASFFGKKWLFGWFWKKLCCEAFELHNWNMAECYMRGFQMLKKISWFSHFYGNYATFCKKWLWQMEIPVSAKVDIHPNTTVLTTIHPSKYWPTSGDLGPYKIFHSCIIFWKKMAFLLILKKIFVMDCFRRSNWAAWLKHRWMFTYMGASKCWKNYHSSAIIVEIMSLFVKSVLGKCKYKLQLKAYFHY